MTLTTPPRQRTLPRADVAVDRAIGTRLRAQEGLAADEAEVRAAWRRLEKRNAVWRG